MDSNHSPIDGHLLRVKSHLAAVFQQSGTPLPRDCRAKTSRMSMTLRESCKASGIFKIIHFEGDKLKYLNSMQIDLNFPPLPIRLI
jgi:hypothetical protein